MIINIHHQKPYDVYIGRAGKGQSGYFGNPILKGSKCLVCQSIHLNGGDTLLCYEIYARKRLQEDPVFKNAVRNLHGKILGCFCCPKQGFQGKLLCHGQVLEKLSAELNMVSWKTIFDQEREKEYFKNLEGFLKNDCRDKTIYPAKENVFRAFKLTPFDQVKVCIIAQDPYHGFKQANGLAFAVNPGIPAPPSLQNIFKEISKKYQRPEDTSLIGWAKQGVLLLNSVLTVEAGKPNSHQGKGWETFTDTAIRTLGQERSNITFLLWGSAARNKKSLIDTNKNCWLETTHPSPYSANSGFLGSDHFDLVNQYLKSINKTEIDWSQSGE